MSDYDPCISPFELPLQEWRLQCSTATPLYLPPGPGHSPGTTLAGAFKEAVWTCSCIRAQSDRSTVNQPSCNRLGDPPRCLQLTDCPVQWLVQPYSVTHRRDLIPSVVLRAPDLERSEPVDHFELRVQLRGRRTIDTAATLERAFECMARRGLNVQGTAIPFRIEKIHVGTTISLRQPPAKKLPQAKNLPNHKT